MMILLTFVDIIVGFIALLLIVFTLFLLTHLYEKYEEQILDLLGFILIGGLCLFLGSLLRHLIWG